ncbi:DHBP synthase RibB-like alpha/beta domain-containing protein [Microdochium trichocladiopsis]|uniref:Threonylcarbamoyl-AMP synthase n=1 Tax=Microdochium trichocladiopsis TaxID=1682393 RepID=A0A9P9BSH9_9PEZI|nr:DHBP synthase RibB-like alpha/beta domain-containing protein [Microdochium trichocladiopsis]KAH7034815.1 DHBP synthase RibB-like alpha/beta domain-containing protein [Microdochium trichocladiopsis]
METRILPVSSADLGRFDNTQNLYTWHVNANQDSQSLAHLYEAAEALRLKDSPVGFPTETVYGLGADATRSAAVKGIYAAKGRPSDNPLIIHIADLSMLQSVLSGEHHDSTRIPEHQEVNLLPEIYKPVIERFWPGPLTILLKNPTPSVLAPEVTAGLPTFGVRMPASALARSLIKLAGAPLAAPSANASTKPSPTTAQHVLEDLDGRIELILDGGPCSVGVESTVVDGMSDPPVVLRPGGVSIDELRACPGWENVQKAYKDAAEIGKEAPRAPGMKYKHYSPKAKVVLYEASFTNGRRGVLPEDIANTDLSETVEFEVKEIKATSDTTGNGLDSTLDISIGEDTRSIAKGLFSALRELDRRGVDIIFVEGTLDDEDIGAAVMNRLRKAASQIRR